MTPDDRYALQRALDALDEAAHAIRLLLDPGEKPRLSAAEYKAQLNRCRCEFGWDSSCPQHRDPAALYVADHQNERPAKADHEHPAPPPWYGQVSCEREDELLAQQPHDDHEVVTAEEAEQSPRAQLMREHLPTIHEYTADAVRRHMEKPTLHDVLRMVDESDTVIIDNKTIKAPGMKPPTPKEVFGD